MGWNILGSLFGNSKVVETMADGIKNGADKMWYTDEEKADFTIQSAETKIKLLEAYHPFKIAQRLLMIFITVPFVLGITLAFLVYSAGAIWPPDVLMVDDVSTAIPSVYGEHLKSAGKEMGNLMAEWLGIPFSIAVAFYLGGGLSPFQKKGK